MNISKEMQQEIKMYQASEWEVSEETPTYVLMKKNTATMGGHILVFCLTVWWTIGIGNLIYHFASNKKKKLIK